MESIWSTMALGLLTALLVLPNPVIAAPQTYPLVCRGGSYEFALRPESDELYFRFKRGTKPASQGVDSGNCAWLDRGVYPDEPSTVCESPIRFQYVVAGASSTDKTYLQARDAVTTFYYRLKNPSMTETFQVYNAGACLRVVRPGK